MCKAFAAINRLDSSGESLLETIAFQSHKRLPRAHFGRKVGKNDPINGYLRTAFDKIKGG